MMNLKVKIILIAVVFLAFIGLGLSLYFEHQRIERLKTELDISVNNNKAYEAENDSLNNKIIEFKFTTAQLNASNDSLIQKLNKTRKQLGIKDKQIKELQYLASVNQKRDTIRLRDTIFREGVALDTLIGDDWSRLAIRAKYPNVLDVDYSFKNSTVVVAHSSRVTVDPPKKC